MYLKKVKRNKKQRTDLVYVGILLGVCEDVEGCVELIEQTYDLHCAS